MGDEITIHDVNGKLVTVPFYPTLSALGEKVAEHETRCASRMSDGRGVEIRLQVELTAVDE